MSFWRGKKVFITGHTGFRGSWLALTLQKEGAEVFGYGLPPATKPHVFEIENVGQGMTSTFLDVRDGDSLKFALESSNAEVVFHLAGGGGLKESWERASDTYSTQVMGTVHLLEALRETATVRAVVMLSSDKVYRSQAGQNFFKETDPLAGSAPVATAKACAELIFESYLQGIFSAEKYNKHKIALATARMGAVIGGGDFSGDSLLFQLAQACHAGLDLPLRNPQSLRPWMHVSDAVSALMTLAEALIVKGPKANGSWNFSGGENNFASVAAVKEIFEKAYGKNSAADVVAEKSSIAVSVHSGVDISKAKEQLGWEPRVSVAEAVAQTAMWYKNFYR